MEISEYRNIYLNECRHFFYRANHSLILDLVKKYTLAKDLSILDAGCGTGLLASKLEMFGKVIGVDISSEALKYARRRGVNVKRASVNNLPFKKNTFDVVASIDVIYHKAIKSDEIVFKEFFRVLKPGGILILRVPANKWLKLTHDKHVHTRERYTKGDLVKKLKKSGLIVCKVSFVNITLLPIAVLKQICERLFPPGYTFSGVELVPPILNKLLIYILQLENLIIINSSVPFGIGLVAVARKPYLLEKT